MCYLHMQYEKEIEEEQKAVRKSHQQDKGWVKATPARVLAKRKPHQQELYQQE